MPTFQTPEPITAVVEVVAGSVRLVATDRDDTVVEVRPRDPSRASDVRAAEQARVDFRNGTLTVAAGRRYISLGRGGAVDIDIALPVGSRLQASSASADVSRRRRVRRLPVRIGQRRRNGGRPRPGNIKADTVSGDVAAAAASTGRVHLDGVGRCDDRRARGRSQVPGRQRWADGSSGCTATSTADGVGDVAVATAVKRRGSRADQQRRGRGRHRGRHCGPTRSVTPSGVVRNALQPSDGPAEGDETVVVHARTGSGDVLVRRATGPRRCPSCRGRTGTRPDGPPAPRTHPEFPHAPARIASQTRLRPALGPGRIAIPDAPRRRSFRRS